MSDDLILLFGGRTYPSNTLTIYSNEIDAAMKTDVICPGCNSLTNCKMIAEGWQVFFDEYAADMYRRPSFRWKKCQHYVQACQQEQEEVVIAPRFRQKNFKSYNVSEENQPAYEKILAYADNFTQITTHGLLLMGPSGTGKTHLASAILKQASERGISFGLVAVVNLLDEIRKGFENKEVYDLTLRVMEKRLLVLDDLGAEKATDWVAERLYKLINHRYEQMQPTIITTNFVVEELESRMGKQGKRIVDRVLEMCELVTFRGQSWRRRR